MQYNYICIVYMYNHVCSLDMVCQKLWRICFGDSLKNIFRYHSVGPASKVLVIILISVNA